MVTAVRSEALLVLASLTGYQAWDWICLLPWGVWLWKGWGAVCPDLRRQPWYLGLGRLMEEVSRLALIGLGLMWLMQHSAILREQRPWMVSVGQVGAPVADQSPSIEVTQDEEQIYHIRISGEFMLHIDGQVARRAVAAGHATVGHRSCGNSN